MPEPAAKLSQGAHLVSILLHKPEQPRHGQQIQPVVLEHRADQAGVLFLGEPVVCFRDQVAGDIAVPLEVQDVFFQRYQPAVRQNSAELPSGVVEQVHLTVQVAVEKAVLYAAPGNIGDVEPLSVIRHDHLEFADHLVCRKPATAGVF